MTSKSGISSPSFSNESLQALIPVLSEELIIARETLQAGDWLPASERLNRICSILKVLGFSAPLTILLEIQQQLTKLKQGANTTANPKPALTHLAAQLLVVENLLSQSQLPAGQIIFAAKTASIAQTPTLQEAQSNLQTLKAQLLEFFQTKDKRQLPIMQQRIDVLHKLLVQLHLDKAAKVLQAAVAVLAILEQTEVFPDLLELEPLVVALERVDSYLDGKK